MRSRTLPGYYHELAERLGMTVSDLRRRMKSDEVTAWIAYDRDHISDPWYQAAMICTTIANNNPFRAKGSRPAKLEDFLPKRGQAKPKKSAQERSIEAGKKILDWAKGYARNG